MIDLVYARTGKRLGTGKNRTDRDFQFAIASLLGAVARSDGSVSTHEVERIVVILRKRFGLDAVSALELTTSAFHDLAQDDNIVTLFDELNNMLNLEQKEELAVQILEVISADGRKEAGEMKILALVVYSLGIPNNVMNRAYDRYFQTRQGRGQRLKESR